MGTVSNISAGAIATNAVNAAQSVTPVANTNPATDSTAQPTRMVFLKNTTAHLLKLALEDWILLKLFAEIIRDLEMASPQYSKTSTAAYASSQSMAPSNPTTNTSA